MRPAFSNALYYPNIDIQNIDWLKTSILFWDSISTIVPESLKEPYKQRDTQYLADIGFLRPLYVHSNDRSVVGIEEDILDILYSPEFLQIVLSSQNNKYSKIWNEKMSYGVKEQLKSMIYSDKMSYMIKREIRHCIHNFNKSEVYFLDDKFVYIYMITLANKLCEDHSLGMITDDIPCFNISNTVRFGNHTLIYPEDHFFHRRPKDHQLEQGVLLDYIINGLSISPDTSIEELIDFKNHHKDELGLFRTQLSKLTQDFDASKPIEIIQQEIEDLYKNEFIPSFDNFKKALKSSGIKWFTNSFFKVSLFSTSSTSVPMALLGLPVEQALFAGIGISIITSLISYNINKMESLRNSPYSYLYAINKKF